MKYYYLFLLAIVFGIIGFSQTLTAWDDTPVGKLPDWKITLESEIYRWGMSEDGKHFFIVTDGEDGAVLNMYSVEDGKMLWTRNLNVLSEEKYKLCRFASNDLFFTGAEKSYVFLNVNDGSVKKSIPLVCESWDDIVWETKSWIDRMNEAESGVSKQLMQPIFIKNYGIFYSNAGFQVLNFSEQSILYQSTQPISRVYTNFVGNLFQIWAYSGGMFSMTPDSSYVLDYLNNKFYPFNPYKNGVPNLRLYIKDYTYNNDRIDFYENSIVYTNLSTNNVEQTLGMNPNEPDYIGPVIWNDELGFVTSQDNVQTLYLGKTLAPIFKTNPGDLPGIIDQFYALDNGDVILFVFNNDDAKMSIARIDSKTGKIIWKNTIFKYDGSFETGHQTGGALELLLKSIGASLVAGILSNYTRQFGYKIVVNQAGIMNSLNKNKYSEGYAKVLSWSNNNITIVAGGKIYSELIKGSHDTYDGESILTFDLKTGKIINNYPCSIIANSDMDNAYNELLTFPLISGNVIIGTNDIYIQKNDNIERLTFGEARVNLVNIDSNSIVIVADNKDEEYCDYWRIDLGISKPKKTLLCRSKLEPVYLGNSFIPIFNNTDYAEFPVRLLIDEDGISAYKLTEGDVSSDEFNNSLWNVSYDDFPTGDVDMQVFIDQLQSKIEEHPSYSFYGSVYGFTVDKEKIIVMGTEGLGFIKSDGSCKWVKEWETDAGQVHCGVIEKKDYIIFSISDNTGIYKIDCTGEVMHQSESSYDATFIIVPSDDSGVLIGVEGEGIEFYKFK